MFAIVDIETTGDHAGANGITEIAIVLHDGKKIEGKFSTLVNPGIPIQKYVQSLTGITDEMVATAPPFNSLAENIFNLLKDRVFVAHNVNFDYSFVKKQLAHEGYNLTTHKLCTIRLTKKIFPNLPKYGLGTVCRELNIQVNDRHRAAGDALATSLLFELLLANDKSGELDKMVKKNANRYLPPHVNESILDELPQTSGIYYFHNKAGKVVYVGKAKNIRKRVVSHFSNNKPSKQKQDFMREIHDITFKDCPTELMAALLESIEIKRLWPAFNKSQKHYEHQYAIYTFEDRNGYLRFGIDKKKKFLQPIASFSLFAHAHSTLWQWVKTYNLHPSLCFLDRTTSANEDLPSVTFHNELVQQIIADAQKELKTFLIKEAYNTYILVENGKFYGMGTIETEAKEALNTHFIKEQLTPYPENEVVRSMLKAHIAEYPNKLIYLE